ncbi:Helix-hairpin-helix motif [Aeromonas rivipollensis]|uniref:helix-hairpin-helix domain-containing protein n=1 Tax=Aeromonas rivipollensis TaxID=948519 RepID=UPI000F8FE0AA
MHWLKRIIFGWDNTTSEPVQEKQIIRLDDQSYHSNNDIISGMEFSATLKIRTPLKALKHHGEIFDGPPSQTPDYGSQADGIWTFQTSSFREIGISIDEPEFTHASDIGPIEPSRYIPFLIQFRTIVEGNLAHEEKLIQLASLPKHSPLFKEIWCKLTNNYEDFPASFFYLQFTILPGIGRQSAKRLYEYGFSTTIEIVNASIPKLTAVPGLGKATATKIKAFKFYSIEQ